MEKIYAEFKNKISDEKLYEFFTYVLNRMENLNLENEEKYQELLLRILVRKKDFPLEKLFNILELRINKNEEEFLNTVILVSSYLNGRIEEKNFILFERKKKYFVEDDDFYAKIEIPHKNIIFFGKEIADHAHKKFPVNKYMHYFPQEILHKIENLSGITLNKRNKISLEKLYEAFFQKIFNGNPSFLKNYHGRIFCLLMLNSEFFYCSQFKILSILLEHNFERTYEKIINEFKSNTQYIHSRLVMYFGMVNYKKIAGLNEKVESFLKLCEKNIELKKILKLCIKN